MSDAFKIFESSADTSRQLSLCVEELKKLEKNTEKMGENQTNVWCFSLPQARREAFLEALLRPREVFVLRDRLRECSNRRE